MTEIEDYVNNAIIQLKRTYSIPSGTEKNLRSGLEMRFRLLQVLESLRNLPYSEKEVLIKQVAYINDLLTKALSPCPLTILAPTPMISDKNGNVDFDSN